MKSGALVIETESRYTPISQFRLPRPLQAMLRRHILSLMLAAGLSVLPLVSMAAKSPTLNLPDIGDAGGNLITPDEERLIGREFMRSVRHSLDILDAPIVTAYLQNLGERLISQIDGYEQKVTFFLVNDPSINAFAGPGGYIGVHTGLILSARTEGELVSVLAHELSHVVQRHLVRSFESGQRMELTTIAAMIAAILIGSQNAQAGQAVLTGAMAGSAQQQLSYSRLHEQEADRVGLTMMARAGFDPREMVSFFETLQVANRYAGLGAVEMLQTHPLTLSRIADARNRAEQVASGSSGDDLTFQLIKARVKILSGDSIYLQRRTAAEIMPLAARQYQQTLAWMSEGEYEKARQGIRQLLEKDGHRVLYHLTAAEIELAAGNQQAARKLLSSALILFPNNLPLTELLAETLLKEGNATEASALLEQQLRHKPNRRLYSLHAQAAQAANRLADAYQSLAELHYLDGNTLQAISYLQQAIDQENNSQYQQLAMQARLHAWKTEVQSAQKDKGQDH